MKRYLDFQAADPGEQTASAMRSARYALCQALFGAAQPPAPGVLDAWPAEALEALILSGWQRVRSAPSALLTRRNAKRAVMAHLRADADCLAPREHALLERLLITGGLAVLENAEDFDAALALHNRLWVDIGGVDGMPAARLDPGLEGPLRDTLTHPEHAALRSRIFPFDAMIHAMLYAAGFLDDRLPRERFIRDVLRADPCDELAGHLARNFLEAAYDCILLPHCRLLVHEGLAVPEDFVQRLAERGVAHVPALTHSQMLGCMNGLLPEERPAVEGLRRALRYALRPELELDDAVEDLKLLVKQGAALPTLKRVLSDILCVLPNPAMDAALRDLINQTPKWLCDWPMGAAASVPMCHCGVLQ